jgi:predicted transcriptional regulator
VTDACHRFPWRPEEEAYVVRAKLDRVSHKRIARELKRTPRAVDQHVARMKEHGKLAMHRKEEAELLKKLEAEALQQEWYRT